MQQEEEENDFFMTVLLKGLKVRLVSVVLCFKDNF